MVDFKDRLAWAMKEENVGTQQLADHLHVSYQAIKKLLDGTSKSMTAKNNDAAASFLKVSSRWLASGKGPRRLNARSEHAAVAQEPIAPYGSGPLADAWIAEAVRTLESLNDSDRRAAVINLRVFVTALGPPRDGQALPVAA